MFIAFLGKIHQISITYVNKEFATPQNLFFKVWLW